MEKYIVFDVETTGLTPAFFDKVTCICAKDDEGNEFKESLKNNSEEELITKFLLWLIRRRTDEMRMITCNGIDFDIPFILLRVLKLELEKIYTPFHNLFDKFQQIDIQRFTNRKVSLNDMALLLKCDLKSGDGTNAIKLYYEKRFRELEDYCMNDVKITEAIYHKIKGEE